VIVLVCGSREWHDVRKVGEVLAGHPRGTVFIHGGARGADQIAGRMAAKLGYESETYPADWRRLGRRAGVVRNLAMLDRKPAKVIAFWDGKSLGTAHTLREAQLRGIPVEIHS